MTQQAAIIPTAADVARIAAQADPALRNVMITQGYQDLARAVRACSGGGANWCAFATWASRQAGRTIRREDLKHSLMARVEAAPELRPLVDGVISAARGTVAATTATGVLSAVARAVEYEGVIDRAADAVAVGNRKVFAEIGASFASFLEASATSEPGAMQAFLDNLAPGEPPEGQGMLREAFAAYVAGAAAAEAERAQLFHYANLLIAYHEQVRLQPEIAAAMNASLDTDAVRDRVVATLLPSLWRRVRYRIAGLFGRRPPLDVALERLLEGVQRALRHVLTANAMTLELPDGSTVRLGRDLATPHSPLLAQVTHPSLADLIRRLDPAPDSLAGSGAGDWGILEQRLHFVAELFRCHYDAETLYSDPFAPTQLAALRAGRLPDPPL
ncbi:MAG TPA: hypothetical protein VK929_04495 [Longimicrobiales bacterium]|nr:hypothetical protein [Longimicrobiales bacterium]